MRLAYGVLTFAFMGLFLWSSTSAGDEAEGAASDSSTPPKLETLPPGLYAVLHTSTGDVILRLFDEQAPKTVGNFVGLAIGQKAWTDPKTCEKVTRPLYKDVVFHRVIPRFMIQTGDPIGTGRGGPGYKFADEIVKELTFDRPGLLAMANSGPNTNGSQFFITTEKTPWLNGKHTIFGEVVGGMPVVNNISYVPRDRHDRPLSPVVLRSIEIKKVEPVPAEEDAEEAAADEETPE